jgi:aconitate hydratase
MGVLPLEFLDGDHAGNHALTGAEELTLDLDRLAVGGTTSVLKVRRADRTVDEVPVLVRIRSGAERHYLEHGGTLASVVRNSVQDNGGVRAHSPND